MHEYYYLVGEDRVGPVTLSELRLLSCLTRETFVWHVDLENWVRADELEESSALFYYYVEDEVQKGPVPLSELKLIEGLETDTLVWHVDLPEWLRADKLPELSDFFAARMHYKMGESYRELKEYDEAITCYQKYIDLNPNDVDAHNRMGLAYYGLKKYNESITYYERCIAIDPNYVNAHNNIGEFLQRVKKI
jgi:tetratricopeptide (TPR) repeat protein